MDFSEDVPMEARLSNAEFALEQIRQGKAKGSVWRLQFRSAIERSFGSLGAVLGRFPWLVIFSVVVVCVLLSLGLLKARFETDESELWVEQGGRLEKELDYTESVLGEGAEATGELLIQVGKEGRSAITPEALLEHLDLVKRVAQNVSVTFYGRKWRYQDLCFTAKPPKTVLYPNLDQLVVALNPCYTPTILDCFWEGSQIHDRPHSHTFTVPTTGFSKDINWSNLDIKEIVKEMKKSRYGLAQSLERALGTSLFTYVEKPCLDPKSPKCPPSARNWNSSDAVNVTQALVDKCKSYANVWHSDLIVSGDTWMTDGASPAVQTIFALNSKQNVRNLLKSRLNKNFTLNDAEDLLIKWRKEFLKVVYSSEINYHETEVHAWTDDSAQDVIMNFSSGSEVLLAVGFILMTIYAGIAFVNIKSFVMSRVNVGVVGVVLVLLACVAGLGVSALCGLPFNPATTQVLPFLVLALGVDDMFVLAHSFFHIFNNCKDHNIPLPEISRQCLGKVGHSITLTSVTNGAGFLLAAIIPIPAMRQFALQVGICVIINYFVLLFAFPAYLCIDGRRVRLGLWDVFCVGRNTVECLRCDDVTHAQSTIKTARSDSTVPIPIGGDQRPDHARVAENWGDRFVRQVYSPLIRNPVVKIVAICITLVLIGLSGYYVTRVEDGLDLTEVVPSGTREHDFVVTNREYFSIRSVTIVHDKYNNFTSPKWQKAALEFHRSFSKVEWILKDSDENGGNFSLSEPFWLEKMIEFYSGLKALYQYRALTGTDSLTLQLLQPPLSTRLGDPPDHWRILDTFEGTDVIPADRFYEYLTAWMSLDLIYPQSSRPDFHPVPPEWNLRSTERIKAAEPLQYAAMPMYATGLKTSTENIELIKRTRDVIAEGKAEGMSAYPRGIPFTFYEQYIGLKNHLYLAVGLILIACLLATSVLLLSVWTGLIMVGMLALTTFEVYGFLGLANIQFSAIPCVSVIVSVGACVEFTAPLCLMFLKVTGSRDQRVHYALMYRFIPIFNGAVSTFLGVIMLAFSEFEFIVRYFLFVFLALLVLGTFNGLVLLPVLLSVIGPPPQVVLVDEVPASNGTSGDCEMKMSGNVAQNGTEVIHIVHVSAL